MTYRISVSKIAIELLVLNILVMVCFSIKEISSDKLYYTIILLNVIVSIYVLANMRAYKVVIDTDFLIIFSFRLGSTPKEEQISYTNLNATYLSELVGKGIKQKRLRLFDKNVLKAELKPSFTGWHHETLESVARDLAGKGVLMQTEHES